MWEERAHRVRREITALAGSGLGVTELHRATIRLVSSTVRADLTCWAAMDPESLVISSMVSGENRIPPSYEPFLAEAEYSAAEPHRFAGLASHGVSVARLSDLPQKDRERSIRFTKVWRPLGLDREARVLFRAEGACWGAAGFVRTGPDFSEREIEFLAAVAPAVAGATRLAVRAEATGAVECGRPAVVIVGPGGTPRAVTPAAGAWQERFDEYAPGRFTTLMQIMAVGTSTSASGAFQTLMRDPRGRWAVLQASRLVGGNDDETAVLIEPATGDRLSGLLLAAYGMTPRERDICHEVMAGFSTTDIAGRLYISPHTVQDHLKSVFTKVGVRSRGELVARLRPEDPGALGPARAVIDRRTALLTG